MPSKKDSAKVDVEAASDAAPVVKEAATEEVATEEVDLNAELVELASKSGLKGVSPDMIKAKARAKLERLEE